MLPADYTRCMGIGCPASLSEKCARHRNIPAEPTAYGWVRTLIDVRASTTTRVRECFIPWEQPET